MAPIAESEGKPRRGPAHALVDTVAAEHHEVDAQSEVHIHLDEEVLTPAAQRFDAPAEQAVLLDRGVALDVLDGLSDQRPGLFPEDDEGRAFGLGFVCGLCCFLTLSAKCEKSSSANPTCKSLPSASAR